jgi:hypothetical protein
MIKCKKCGCEIDDVKSVTALEIDMLDFWGCADCKKQYRDLFEKQKLKSLVKIKDKNLF